MSYLPVSSHQQKVTCPECGECIYDIARHMRSRKHNWTPQKAKYAKAHLGIRIRKPVDSSPIKRLRPFVKCPYLWCNAAVTRLGQHIRKKHSEQAMKKVREQNTELLLKSYKMWQESPDSGGLTETTIKRQMSQVKVIIEDENMGKLDNMLDEVKVSNLFTTKVQGKKWEATSAATYLFSINSFYRFLSTTFFKTSFNENKKLFNCTLESIQKQAAVLQASTLRWARTFTKASKEDIDDKYEKDRQNLLSKEEWKKCKKGEMYKQVKSIMGNFSKDHSNPTNDFIVVRNYIAVNIFLRNAHRAGVASYMKLDKFREARRTAKGKYIIHVKRHKTNKCFGNASVIVDKQFYHIMKFYCTNLRPTVLKGNESEWFILTRDGTQLNSSGINHAVKAFMKLEGIKKSTTTGLLRKYATTNTESSERKDLSSLMMHSEAIAQKCYNRADKEMARLRAEAAINVEDNSSDDGMLFSDDDDNDDVDGDNDDGDDDDAADKDDDADDRVDYVDGEKQIESEIEIKMKTGVNTLQKPNENEIEIQTSSDDDEDESSVIDGRDKTELELHDGRPKDESVLSMNNEEDKNDTMHFEREQNNQPNSAERAEKVLLQKQIFQQNRKSKFTENDTNLLFKAFNEYFNTVERKSLTLNTIRVRLNASFPKLLKKYTLTQLRTRLNYMRTKSMNTDATR